MKKILFVATVVKKHINVFHLPYIKMLHDMGWSVDVAAADDFDDEEWDIPYCDNYYDIPFARFPIKCDNIKAYKMLKKLISENKYDVIHCHTPVGGMLARLAAHTTDTKVIYTAHGFHFFKGAPILNWVLYYPVEKYLSKYTDVLITINQEDYNLAVNKFKAKKICYVPGVGIDTKEISECIADKNRKREELGVPENAIMLLSVGELNENKNHEVIIRAVAKLNNSDVHYYIAGQGALSDYLSNLAQELNVKNQIHLLGFRNDVTQLCKAADIFCFPSKREGLSVALMEAMVCGLPVVASQIRGNTDLIENGKNGFLYAPCNVDDFKSGIEKLMNMQERELGEIAFYNKEKMQKFDMENVKKEMKRIYEEV